MEKIKLKKLKPQRIVPGRKFSAQISMVDVDVSQKSLKL